jgi:uncharacterized membrane protein
VKHKSSKRTFKRTFLTGLVVVLPLLITFWVIRFLFGNIDKAVTPYVLNVIQWLGLGRWLEEAWANWFAPVVSVFLAILVIYALGLFGGNVLGRQLLAGLEKIVMQVPFVRGIYSASRQFLDTFSKTDGNAFSRVVLLEYPRPGVWTMALVTNNTDGEVQSYVDRNLTSLFIPTTPNPTSGWLLFVPEEDLITLEMSVDEAFKMIISGGVLTPQFPSKT